MAPAQVLQRGRNLIREYTLKIKEAEADIRQTYTEGEHTNVDSARERIKLNKARCEAIERFLALITEEEAPLSSITALTEENQELEGRVQTLETILIALCMDAQVPLHVTQKEYDKASDLLLDIEDDEEGGMLISAKTAGAKLNKIIDAIADNLK